MTSNPPVPRIATGSTPLLLRFQEFGHEPGLISMSGSSMRSITMTSSTSATADPLAFNRRFRMHCPANSALQTMG